MGTRSRASLATALILAGCMASDPPRPPPGPSPGPQEAPAPTGAPPVDTTPLKRAYTVAAARERAAVLATDDADFVRRVRTADASARAALARLEAPGGRTVDRLAKARAAVGQLQNLLREAEGAGDGDG